MEENNECGICGGNLYDINLAPMHSFFPDLPYMTLKKEINNNLNIFSSLYIKLKRKRKDFNYDDTPKQVGYITGADMMIRKEILDQIGGFDVDFFMYSEEVELTYRVYKAGYTSFSVPEAKIVHLEGKSTVFKENKFRMIYESKYKYFYKIANLKTCKYAYYVYQIKNILFLIFKLNYIYLKLYKINREEYHKFLMNYHKIKKGKINVKV